MTGKHLLPRNWKDYEKWIVEEERKNKGNDKK